MAKNDSINIVCLTRAVDRYVVAITKDSEELVKCVMSDYKRKSQTVAKNAIAKVYNVKKGKIFAGGEKGLGTMSLTGSLPGMDLGLKFTGPVLRPMAFGMRPMTPPGGEKPYKLTQMVYKGKREQIGEFKRPKRKGRKRGVHTSTSSPTMLFNLVSKKQKAAGEAVASNWLPGRRDSRRRTDISTFKTTSVAGMARNEDVKRQIVAESEGYLLKRIEHHYKRLMQKHS